MNMMTADHINVLEHCRPWIEAALEHSNGTHEYEDIVEGLIRGRYQLWPAPEGCIVTEILTFPRRKILNIFLASGNLNQILVMHDDLYDWAKARGCDGGMMTGRPGWERVLEKDGWKRKWVTMTKDID